MINELKRYYEFCIYKVFAGPCGVLIAMWIGLVVGFTLGLFF